MAEENLPKDRERENHGNTENDRIDTTGDQVGAPLGHISSRLTSLIDEIIDAIKANHEKNERSRSDYQPKQLFWQKFVAISSVVLSACSLLLSALTLVVLNKTLGIMDKQRELATGQLEAMAEQLKEMQSAGMRTDKLIEEAIKQSGATKTQADAASRMARTVENTLHLTEAADLELDRVSCFTPSQPLSLKTEITPVFRNTGRTRAEEVKVSWSLGIPGRPNRSPTKLSSMTTVAAGNTVEAEGIVLERSLTEKDLALVNDGTAKLHLWGFVTYKDIFNKVHRLEFDTIYLPNTPCTFNIEKITTR
jgi:hypothetical protein